MRIQTACILLLAACATSSTTDRSQAYPVLSVGSVLAGAAPIGAVVRVQGRCLGYGSPSPAEPPPRTRSDWQFAGDSTTIYVEGTFPSGCDAMTGSLRIDTIQARVVIDTLRWPGRAPTTRLYLERVR